MRSIILFLGIPILLVASFTYRKWSYKAWYDRNKKHYDEHPEDLYTGKMNSK